MKSPVNGVVTRRDVESGQTVSPASRLGVIRVMDALRIETFVSQKDINHVSVGMTAKVTSPGGPGQAFVGRVDQVSSSAEVATGNFEVGVVVEDSANLLRDGMSAMVEFRSAEQAHTLAVPRKALVDRGRRAAFSAVAVINNRRIGNWRLDGYRRNISRWVLNPRWTSSPVDVFLNNLRCNPEMMDLLQSANCAYTLLGILKVQELEGTGHLKKGLHRIRPVVAVPGLVDADVEKLASFEEVNEIRKG